MLRTLVTLSILMLSAVVSTVAGANTELDNEASVTNEQIRLATDLPAAVVVRTHLATGRVEVLQTNSELAADSSSQNEILQRSAEFKTVSASQSVQNELDTDSSSSSWYFFFYNYNYAYPAYGYAGYTYHYAPYYNYSWGGYAYSYYRWYW